jgi:hypothetical protein
VGKPRKFTVSIYCGNCTTVADYEFRRGTILHAERRQTWAEYRNTVPGGDDTHTIRLNHRHEGKYVECRFCGCTTALHIRQRTDAPQPPATEPDATTITEGVANA